jgi:hypothetical protein
MPRIGVITNPRSHANKRRGDRLTEALADAGRIRHVALGAMDEIPGILADFARQEVDVLAVAGGDGTVQAVLTEIYGSRPFADPPRLAVIPRGMTNMIAADVGLRRGGLQRLADLASPEDLERVTVRRRILRVENARDRAPQYGMFFGGAAIYRAILACRSDVHPLRITADAAAAVTLAGILGRSLFARRGPGDQDQSEGRRRILSGDRIGIGFDDQPAESVTSLVVLATTLDRLILRSRPFWNTGNGHVRFTSVGYPAKQVLRYVLRVLYGGDHRDLPPDCYRSRSADRVSLAMDCPFTIDGELFEPEPGVPLILTAADQARFVRL